MSGLVLKQQHMVYIWKTIEYLQINGEELQNGRRNVDEMKSLISAEREQKMFNNLQNEHDQLKQLFDALQ